MAQLHMAIRAGVREKMSAGGQGDDGTLQLTGEAKQGPKLHTFVVAYREQIGGRAELVLWNRARNAQRAA